MVELRNGDYMKRLIEYIEKNISKGYTIDQLKIILIQQGYSRAAVDRAITLVQARRPKPQPVIVKEKPKIEYTEVQKKPGFFAKLFGKGKKKVEEGKVNPETGNLM